MDSGQIRERLDRLHAAARRVPALQRLAIISRILLAVAFIPTGLTKLLGNRFTTLSVGTPIGAFFEAMYQTGVFWRFIGLAQVLAALFLLIPATRTLGAVIFFPLMLSVTVVTWALDFTGTIYITPLMLLASFFLLCWDYDRLRGVFFAPTGPEAEIPRAPIPAIERAGYVLGTLAALVVLLALRGLAPMATVRWMFLLAGGAVILVLVGWVQAGTGRVGRLKRAGRGG